MTRTPTWAKVLLALLLGAFAMWLFSCYNARAEKKQEAYKATADSLARMRPLLDSALANAGAHTDTVTRERIIYTDRILAGDRPTIPRGEVVELANRCKEVERSCAAQKKAAAAIIANLDSALKIERKRVALSPPRLRLGVEGGWDFTTRQIPARGRAELKVAGPISLVGEAELRIPTDTVRLEHSLRALIRYEFR